jgi:hypothetical protein
MRVTINIIVILSALLIKLGCDNSNEPEEIERINPLIGYWELSFIGDEDNSYITGPEGIDGSVRILDLRENGAGEAHILEIWRTVDYPATWSSSGNFISINIEDKGELNHRFDLLYSNGKMIDDPPLTVTLVLHDDNQFTKSDSMSYVFNYTRTLE